MTGRAWLAVPLLLAACAAPGGPAPSDDGRMVTPASFKPLTDTYREYVACLVRLKAPLPEDRRDALNRLEAINYSFFEDDRALIAKARGGDEPARVELVRRGETLDALFVFWGKVNLKTWNEARVRICALGEDARILLVTTLLRMLINGQFREDWMAIRYQLVKVGDDAFATALELLRRKAADTPDTPIFKQDDLVQLLILVLEFKEKGRDPFLEMAGHPKYNVRKSVVRAVGEAQASEYVDVAVRLLAADANWEVRAAAAQALGHLRTARAAAGKALLDRLSVERDPLVRGYIVTGLGDLGVDDAVPVLISVLDVPDVELQDKAVLAHVEITGVRLGNAGSWRAWFAKDYPAWRRKRRP